MRDLKELFIIVRKYIDKNHGISLHGICDAVNHLYAENKINESEYDNIMNYLDENLPSEIKHGPSQLYCWNIEDKQIRLEWIDEHLNEM